MNPWTKPIRNVLKRNGAISSEKQQSFDMLDAELPHKGCDHTRRLTKAWLLSPGHDINRVFAWLDSQAAFCDCEILANVEQSVDEATRSTIVAYRRHDMS